MNVYLGGPMEGCTKEEMTGWRIQISEKLNLRGIVAFDPCRRTPYHDGPRDMNACRFIFKSDLMDIDNCDVFMADIRKKQGTGTGTSMEIMYAWMKHKPIVLWADPEDSIHPFYESMCTVKHFNLSDVVKSIVDFRK